MEIARARTEDAAALTSIAFAAKRHWGYPESWIVRWTNALTVTPAYIETHPTFVADIDGQVGGFHALQLNFTEAHLDHLWILPSAMRRGIGRALFEHAERTARDAGAAMLLIESDPHTEEFYGRMGATVYGHQSAPMDGQMRFLPLLRKAL